MARVKGRDTGPEVTLRRALYAAGVRGWRCHRKSLPGRPDVAFGPARLAVFVDGAFWHGHPLAWAKRCLLGRKDRPQPGTGPAGR
ncbi:MAG: hypothetical protein ACR2LK_15525 [Solirubrobacteraceae bacterium]